MIRYDSGSFGLLLLFRLHGSAVFKAILPALISSGVYLALFYSDTVVYSPPSRRIIGHPYALGALIAALTFLLAFRANFAYNRYWEAFTAVHQMHSKWLDVGMELASFHLQSARYDAKKPPTFASLDSMVGWSKRKSIVCAPRERRRVKEQTYDELQDQLDEALQKEKLEQEEAAKERQQQDKGSNFGLRLRNTVGTVAALAKMKQPANGADIAEKQSHDTTSISKKDRGGWLRSRDNQKDSMSKAKEAQTSNPDEKNTSDSDDQSSSHSSIVKNRAFAVLESIVRRSQEPNPLTQSNVKVTSHKRSKIWGEGKDEPLFLEEVAHLISLLSAVALSTLRNDLEQADSPLITFKPGQPFPHVDPDEYGADVRQGWTTSSHRSWTTLKFFLGLTRTHMSRTLYNAARPFRVIGGVSDAEIEFLQAARGPLAKVALCSMWLQEFITREYMAGSTGKVAPPILSRLYQFTSDGMIGYNQARKVTYIPFPFPHAQITVIMVMVVVGLMPVLMISFTNNVGLGFVLNLVTVMCFAGLHEVARELENPFTNVPNDVPLNNFQAQFNEALMTMFSGYHPDSYWQVTANKDESDESDSSDKDGDLKQISEDAADEEKTD